MDKPSRVVPEVELEPAEPGRQHGFLRLFHSVHRSAYGFVPIPITVVQGARPGPTALLTAGNHGDEWEGQIVLSELARELEPGDVSGRVIVVSALNLPASMASQRVSPLDGVNLNRAFPGDRDGTVTQEIAHFVSTVLVPRTQVVCDLHSGGSSLMYAPCALATRHEDPARLAGTVAALRAFGAPLAYMQGRAEGQGGQRTLGAQAEARGILSLGTELGGAGTVTPAALAMARRGVRNLLSHVGVLPQSAYAEPEAPTRILSVSHPDQWVYAHAPGVFEPLALPGDEVEPGQPAARLHYPEAPWEPPVEIAFKRGGLVLVRRHPGRAERGDCLFGLGADWGG